VRVSAAIRSGGHGCRSSKAARVFEVDELLNNLKLSEEENEGVFLAKEEMGSLPVVKWMAVRSF
jgi:hypothetical protein